MLGSPARRNSRRRGAPPEGSPDENRPVFEQRIARAKRIFGSIAPRRWPRVAEESVLTAVAPQRHDACRRSGGAARSSIPAGGRNMSGPPGSTAMTIVVEPHIRRRSSAVLERHTLPRGRLKNAVTGWVSATPKQPGSATSVIMFPAGPETLTGARRGRIACAGPSVSLKLRPPRRRLAACCIAAGAGPVRSIQRCSRRSASEAVVRPWC